MRIQSTKAAEILGISRRLVQIMAATGDLPGAAKFRSVWTFDVDKLNAFVRAQEEKTANEAVAVKRALQRKAPAQFPRSKSEAKIDIEYKKRWLDCAGSRIRQSPISDKIGNQSIPFRR